MKSKLTFKFILSELDRRGLRLIGNENDYVNYKSYVHFEDNNGYRYSLCASNIQDITTLKLTGKYNAYSIYNINQFLLNNGIRFDCISNHYINAETEMEFKCQRCGEIILSTWHNINRKDNYSRHHLLCPNCDGRFESIHAIVLKQIFKHEHPDTIEEEKSCRNPLTGKVMPTDIVNHRLKIAIEIQSQWHDFRDKKEKDAYKKQFWIEKGYQFYDPDIRDYSVLEMARLFFNIEKLPDYIDYDYSNKINISIVQNMLDAGNTVPEIEKKTKFNRHRIYDALYSGKLVYPTDYGNACFVPIVQLDMNGDFIAEYDSLSAASRATGLRSGSIGKALRLSQHYSGGYYWCYKSDYELHNFKLESRFSKFHVPVSKYDKQGNFICSYASIIEASKDNNITCTRIYNAAIGKAKLAGGCIYKIV